MNNDRRKRLQQAISILQGLSEQVEEARSIVEEARDEEQEYLDNMPESLQSGEKGERTQAAINELESAVEAFDAFQVDDLIANIKTAAE